MLVVKNSSIYELEELKNKYKIILDLDYKNPTFYFTFKDYENIIGYSEVKICNKLPELVTFYLQEDMQKSEKLFFLKGTGSKVKDLGFDYLKLRDNVIDFYSDDTNIIILDELFEGNCNECKNI